MFSEESHKNETNKLPINDNNLNSLYYDTELPGELFKQNPDYLIFSSCLKGKGR